MTARIVKQIDRLLVSSAREMVRNNKFIMYNFYWICPFISFES